jgi:hypothetical protein
MPRNEEESFTDILRELDKNKFVRLILERWNEQAKRNMQTTIVIVLAVLATILILNWWGKLSVESNGWVIAALIGYLFGRGSQNMRL